MDAATVKANLQALNIADVCNVTYITGSNNVEISKSLAVVKKTKRSITFIAADGSAEKSWTVKYNAIGNDQPFANRIVEVAA